MINREYIIQIIAENLCVETKECLPELYLMKNLGADSLSLLALYTDLIDFCNVYISIPERIEDLQVQDIIRIVNDEK